jgi:small neutral amino acid transporter SnatA (MarC family)
MYRESINLLAFLTGFLLVLSAIPVMADPATEETLIQLEATVTQNSSISVIVALVVLVVLGFIAGQQR